MKFFVHDDELFVRDGRMSIPNRVMERVRNKDEKSQETN